MFCDFLFFKILIEIGIGLEECLEILKFVCSEFVDGSKRNEVLKLVVLVLERLKEE